MSAIIIDRRGTKQTSTAENVRRFKEHEKNVIRHSLVDQIKNQKVGEKSGNGSEVVIKDDIDVDGLSFQFQHTVLDSIFVKNNKYRKGDRIPKQKVNSKGRQPGKGEEEDSFKFYMSEEEYLDILFADCYLPISVEKKQVVCEEFQYVHAGFKANGMPTNLHVVRSFKNALARNFALEAAYDEEIENKKQELEALFYDTSATSVQTKQVAQEIVTLQNEKECVPYIDDIDLRFRYFEKEHTKTSKMVMFCMMDVSGSMDEARKERAKRFFYLTYRFLKTKYDKCEVVFISHTDEAKICDEEEFFYGKRSGGTTVFSAYELAQKVINDKYPSTEYNIYVVHATDGEVLSEDLQNTHNIVGKYFTEVCSLVVNLIVSESEYIRDYTTDYVNMNVTLALHKKNFYYKILETNKDVLISFYEIFKRYAKPMASWD